MLNIFNRRKTWVVPPASILSDATGNDVRSEYIGAYIGTALEHAGISAEHVKSTFGVAVAEHHFNLSSISDIRKIKSTLPAIGAILHTVDCRCYRLRQVSLH